MQDIKATVRRYVLEASDLAISVQGCGTLHGRSDLLPPTRDRPKGVGDAYVFPTGERHLVGLRVPFVELTCSQVILLNYFVKISYRRHL